MSEESEKVDCTSVLYNVINKMPQKMPNKPTKNWKDDENYKGCENYEAASEAYLEFLQNLHIVLFDISIFEGTLICPESGREFPIERGITNMLLHDDEIGQK